MSGSIFVAIVLDLKRWQTGLTMLVSHPIRQRHCGSPYGPMNRLSRPRGRSGRMTQCSFTRGQRGGGYWWREVISITPSVASCQPIAPVLSISSTSIPSDKLLSVDVVNGQDMVFGKKDLFALAKSVQSSFHERIVNDATEVAPGPFPLFAPRKSSPQPRDGTFCSGNNKSDDGWSCLRIGFVISPLQEGHEHFSAASSCAENREESILSSTK